MKSLLDLVLIPFLIDTKSLRFVFFKLQFLRNWGGSLSDPNQLSEAKVMICCPLLKEAKMIMTG